MFCLQFGFNTCCMHGFEQSCTNTVCFSGWYLVLFNSTHGYGIRILFICPVLLVSRHLFSDLPKISLEKICSAYGQKGNGVLTNREAAYNAYLAFQPTRQLECYNRSPAVLIGQETVPLLTSLWLEVLVLKRLLEYLGYSKYSLKCSLLVHL